MLQKRLDAIVRERFAESWNTVRKWIETGKILVDGVVVTDPGAQTALGAGIELKMNAPRPRAAVSSAKVDLVHVDTQVVVVNKPPGISTVPYEKDERGSLEQLVGRELKQPRLIVVHRLDRETSGLLVFARNHEAGKHLANQFRFHTVRRRYVALVHGAPKDQVIRSLLVENRGDGLRGSIRPGMSRDEAKEAITHVRVLRPLGAYSLIECRLETGRTHQIRIHLSEAGHPLVGEKAYVREFTGVRVPAPRLMLHAAELGFIHPTREVPVHWEAEPPSDFQALLNP